MEEQKIDYKKDQRVMNYICLNKVLIEELQGHEQDQEIVGSINHKATSGG